MATVERIPISGMAQTYADAQLGDTFAMDRAGVMGKITYADLSASFINTLGVGTIQFATVAAGFARVTTPSGSRLDLQATAVADTHERTRLERNETSFVQQTGNSAGNTWVTDYSATIGAAGASFHGWRIDGALRFGISDNRTFLQSGAVVASDFIATNVADTHERLRIFKDTAGYGLQTVNAVGDSVITDYSVTVGASGATQHAFQIQGAQRLLVDVSGCTSPAFTLSSDARLKEDIRDLTEAERAAAAKIKTRTFIMKEDGQRKIGYIAQEVIAAMESEGLCAFEYGLVVDGETYAVNYDAINAFRLG